MKRGNRRSQLKQFSRTTLIIVGEAKPTVGLVDDVSAALFLGLAWIGASRGADAALMPICGPGNGRGAIGGAQCASQSGVDVSARNNAPDAQ
jgi:hypothetical protein